MRLIRLLRPLLLALLVSIAGAGVAAAQSPFGPGAPSAPSAAESGPPAAAAARPNFVRRLYGELLRWQGYMIQKLAAATHAYKENGALGPVFGILLISLLYGMGHAVGPGHGKTASAAYFGANRATAIHGVSMSAMIGLVQALSAIAIVGAFALIFRVSQTETVHSIIYAEVASYALIAGVGLWIAWGGLTGRGCTHDHGLGGHHHHHDHHDHDHTAHGHGHDHAHGHDHGHAAAIRPAAAMAGMAGVRWRSMVPVALASGIRPCTGAILVLLFTLTQGMFFIGVLATLAMSFGTFLVVAGIGLGVIYARRAASKASGRSERVANIAQRAMGLCGGLVVFLFGIAFLVNALQQLGLNI
jgi:ABC-type nickel/cobalt efflux system permease component RcnA